MGGKKKRKKKKKKSNENFTKDVNELRQREGEKNEIQNGRLFLCTWGRLAWPPPAVNSCKRDD